MSNEFEEDLQPNDENIIAYGQNIGNMKPKKQDKSKTKALNVMHNNEQNDKSSSSSDEEYDSDTSLSSTHTEKSIEINKKEGDIGYIVQKKQSLVKILKKASQSKYSPMVINEEIISELEELDHPPLNKKSFIWGAILMFIASFLFSISTTIIKWNHSFGRESFEIFVFRMFIQLFVTTMVASISVVMNHHYCYYYESISVFSATEWDEGDTETEWESDAELGENISPQLYHGQHNKHKHKHKGKRRRNNKNKNKNLHKLSSIIRGQYKFQKPCCQVRCVYTTVFANFWKETSSTVKWYILARGLCGGTGILFYFISTKYLQIISTKICQKHKRRCMLLLGSCYITN